MSEKKSNPTLFPKGKIIGSFKGFAERGFEFAADLVIPYTKQDIPRPQFGQFILVELSNEDEAALGRITKMIPAGLLTSAEGEDYIEKMRAREERVPDELKQRKLKYRVQVKLLGAVRRSPFRFTASQRRMPHLGAKVAWPSQAVLEKLCGLGCESEDEKTDLGDFALGEFIYSGGEGNNGKDIHLPMSLSVGFNIRNLIARRTAVFARAGYGKSNLVKYLVSELYEKEPKTDDGRPVGTLIFDADGEYFWPNKVNNRPGLCDVPHLRDKISVFTNRTRGDDYDKWTGGGVKLDLRALKPHDVLSIALSPERFEQQNVRRMMSRKCKWSDLVDLTHKMGYPDTGETGKLLGYASNEEIRTNTILINAAIGNIGDVVRRLHDPDSRLVNGALQRLKEGGVVIVDLSTLSSSAGEHVAGLLLHKIFSHNQEKFTSQSGGPLPVVAMIEEAQRVLGAGRMDESSPFVEWVKEGRKYDLGAMLVTQQPGAISGQLLSQVDNWFCFHLLSQGDAAVLGKYNSHYSSDILAHMVAEPIVGNCFMWSAPHQPFVLPVRIRNFDDNYRRKKGGAPDAPKVPRSEEVVKENDAAEKKMAEGLRTCMHRERHAIKLVDFGDMQGIWGKQLYRLICKIKPESEMRREDDLKWPLFRRLFSGAEIREKDDEEYYCAPESEWEKVLGRNKGK